MTIQGRRKDFPPPCTHSPLTSIALMRSISNGGQGHEDRRQRCHGQAQGQASGGRPPLLAEVASSYPHARSAFHRVSTWRGCSAPDVRAPLRRFHVTAIVDHVSGHTSITPAARLCADRRRR